MLAGVDRPALAAAIPRPEHPAVLLDVGATIECRPSHLVQFAVMGAVYARVAFGIESPRVGLLSIGEEATKGNELTREAHRLLQASPLSFIGNVEARDVYTGKADVIVCDGFTGNVALKVSEGLVEVLAGLPSRGSWRASSGRLRPRRYLTSDRIHFSGTGVAESRHGPRACRRVSDLSRYVCRSRRGARRAAEPADF
jgi:glycerol-3-phosphate acyltransferase PlsX